MLNSVKKMWVFVDPDTCGELVDELVVGIERRGWQTDRFPVNMPSVRTKEVPKVVMTLLTKPVCFSDAISQLFERLTKQGVPIAVWYIGDQAEHIKLPEGTSITLCLFSDEATKNAWAKANTGFATVIKGVDSALASIIRKVSPDGVEMAN
ncbi:MAG: hypothetical protein AAB589_01795 [Patescibacteria group bacterium]